MQDLIWDAVPAQRQRKQEQFTVPVLTMSALVKAGGGRKFTFNKASQSLLEIEGEDRVSFGFSADGQHIFVRKAADKAGFVLTKTCTLSDKRTFEFIAKRLNLNTEVENHFAFTACEYPGVFELLTMTVTEAPVFVTTELGEISDEEDLSADLDSLPEVPEGGNVYTETPLVIYSEEPIVVEAPTEDFVSNDSTNEDIW
jgi:hypothetical protein